MSTIILLSSSPPPTFAPSPTQLRSSSPVPFTTAFPLGHSPGRGRFRVEERQRDGFVSNFSTARQILTQKIGTENTLNKSIGKNKFRSSQENPCEENIDQDLGDKWRKTKSRCNTSKTKVVERTELSPPQEEIQDGVQVIRGDAILPTECIEKSLHPESLLLERAVARRLDWTPPKPTSRDSSSEKPVEYSAGFMNGVLNDFKYKDSSKSEPPTRNDNLPNPPKRRRIEHLREDKTSNIVSSIPGSVVTKTNSSILKPKTNRSPVKKPLTITGLATSNYLGDSDVPDSSIVQFLISTQAQLNNTLSDRALESEVQKTKAAASRLKTQRKKQPKSLLASPGSAIKTYDEQEAIFGSASQLAQEETPAFLREMIEATKQSESFVISDAASSPQCTQMVSVENTPKAGVTRYRKTRNLWSAAGRDEDNALLHIDTVDLTDTPAVRAAFAGKDVMLQPGTNSKTAANECAMPLSGGFSPLRAMEMNGVIDINDIHTLNVVQARTFCSTTKSASPRKSSVRTQPGKNSETQDLEPKESKAKEPIPPKPNYAGLTVRELNKHITSFGFKAMRKREKMIELLNRCWEEKYGLSETVEVEPEKVPYGNFLSNVHDISERPQPKVKKTPTRRKKADIAATTDDVPAKKPRQRKKKAEAEDPLQEKPKAPRKRKPKASQDMQEAVLDVDQLWNQVPEELRALEVFDHWAKPARKPKVKAVQTDVEKQSSLTLLPTPPATLPTASMTTISISSNDDTPAADKVTDQATSDTASATPRARARARAPSVPVPASPNDDMSPTPTSSLPSLSSQITSAIMHQSTSNPVKNPILTWHQKILLYDPIILEDLALWLNTEGLAAVREDREVGVLDVREWCEAYGVCCLHRGGWRGGINK